MLPTGVLCFVCVLHSIFCLSALGCVVDTAYLAFKVPKMNDSILLKYVGHQIQQRRIKKGLTQRELSVGLDISRASVNRLEGGYYGVSGAILWKVAILLECKIDDLFPEKYSVLSPTSGN